jgi:hypothetical protein
VRQTVGQPGDGVDHLFLSLNDRCTFKVGKSANKSHYFEFEGVPGIAGKWSLPLTCEHARLVVRRSPLSEEVKRFLISILTAEIWTWE